MKQFTIEEINEVLKGTIVGSITTKITAPEQLEVANETEISFIGNKKYEKFWAISKACVAVVNEDISIEPGENRAFIKVKNADLAMSQVLSIFAPPPPVFKTDIHPTATIDDTAQIGDGTKIWHFSHIMANCVIGEKCNLGQNVVVSPGVILGKNVKVQNNVSIYTGVKCEDDVFLGPSMVFTNVINPRSAVNRRDQYSETIVGKGASIGANATIVCGNPIGEYALIGAGAVVTKPIKPFALVVGNPSKQIGWVSEYGHRLHFDEKGIAKCEESGKE